MSLPQFQIAVLDVLTGAVKAIFDAQSLYNCRYSRALNDIGTFAMTMPSTADIRAVFTLDSLIEVYRANAAGTLVKEETYLTRSIQRFIESDTEQFVVGGLSLNHLLARRIIDPDDDPLTAGGYSTKSGPADVVIYEYCNEQAGPGASVLRRIPGLTLTSQPIGRPIGARLRHENLFTQVQALAKSGAVDFAIERTTGVNFRLTIGQIGLDKTEGTNAPLGLPWVGLSPLRGNLTAPSLLQDRKEEANYIYGLGQGQRDQRMVYKLAGVGLLDSPLNRLEFAEDIRNVERSDALALITGTQSALRERMLKKEFTYQPTGTEPGNIYRDDWDLGDAVSCQWEEDQFDLRIVNVEIAFSAEGETITATVSDDFVFPGTPMEADVELPTRATLWQQDSTVVVGGALTAQLTPFHSYGFYCFSDGNDGYSFTQSFLLAAGVYTISFLGRTGASTGKVDWYLDNVLVISGQDWYSAGTVSNVVKTAAVTVTGDGYHVLRAVVNGRNGASGGYYINLTKIWVKGATD